MSLRLQLHKVIVGTALKVQVQGVCFYLVVRSYERSVGTDVESIWVHRRYLPTLFVGPSFEVIAEVLSRADGNCRTLVELATGWRCRHFSSVVHAKSDTHRICWHRLYLSCHIACDGHVAESILFVYRHILDIYLYVEYVIRRRYAAKFECVV